MASKLFLSLIALFLFIACQPAVFAVNSEPPPAKTPTCAPIPCEHTLAFAIDPFFKEYRQAVLHSMWSWSKATQGRSCFVELPWDTDKEDILRINRAFTNVDLQTYADDDGYGNHLGLYRPYYNDMWIVTGEDKGDYRDEFVSGIAAHELGHALGLKHRVDLRIPSAMHPMVDHWVVEEPHVFPHDYEKMCSVRGGCRCAPRTP